MGLYNYLNGEQIKCFYHPFITDSGEVGHSGGSLVSFGNGDRLPMKTLYYRYEPNCLFIDFDLSYPDFIAHVVKDDYLAQTVFSDELTPAHFEGIQAVYNYYGTRLNIECLDGLNLFLKESFSLREYRASVRKEAEAAFREVMAIHRSGEGDFKTAMDRYQVLDRQAKNILAPHQEEHYQRWYPAETTNSDFGEFLHCFIHRKESDLAPGSGFEKAFQLFLRKHPTAEIDYFNWLQEKNPAIESELKQIVHVLMTQFSSSEFPTS